MNWQGCKYTNLPGHCYPTFFCLDIEPRVLPYLPLDQMTIVSYFCLLQHDLCNMPPSSNSLSYGSQSGRDNHALTAAVASAAFSLEAAATGAPRSRSFFNLAPSGGFVSAQFLSGVIPGGYRTAAAAAARDASAYFIYLPIGFSSRLLEVVPRPHPLPLAMRGRSPSRLQFLVGRWSPGEVRHH